MSKYYVVRVDGLSNDAEAGQTLEEAIGRCFAEDISCLEFTQVEALDRYEAVELAQAIQNAGWKAISHRPGA